MISSNYFGMLVWISSDFKLGEDSFYFLWDVAIDFKCVIRFCISWIFGKIVDILDTS